MSLQELQEKAAALSSEDRRKLAAFLVALRMQEAGEWGDALVDDGSGWVSLEEAKRRLLPRQE
jgi:hypothetical protein